MLCRLLKHITLQIASTIITFPFAMKLQEDKRICYLGNKEKQRKYSETWEWTRRHIFSFMLPPIVTRITSHGSCPKCQILKLLKRIDVLNSITETVLKSVFSPDWCTDLWPNTKPLLPSEMNVYLSEGYFLLMGWWGCTAGWGCIFTNGLTIMGIAFSTELLQWGRTLSGFWG